MTTEAERRRALILLALCGLFWSTAGALIKLVHWNAGAIWSVRSLIAVIGLYAIRPLSMRGITKAEILAAVGLATTTGLFVLGNKLTTAANAILIQYSAPIWVALVGNYFLGERATRLDWITIFVVIGGIALFFMDQLTTDNMLGNVVALAAGVSFAGGALAMRATVAGPSSSDIASSSTGPRPPPFDPLRPLFLGNVLGAVIGAPFIFKGPLPDATGWGALVVLGIVQQAFAYLCYAGAIRHAKAIDVMLVPIVEPILSPVWVAIFFGEIPGPWALVGGTIVVAAVTGRALLSSRR